MQNYEDSLSISILNGLVKQNRVEDFKSIVSNINYLHLIDIGGTSLIHEAAAKNNNEIVAFLFNFGFDVNTKNQLGQTPLHLAVINNSYQSIQLLLSLNANILITDNKGISSLQLCFEKDLVPKNIVNNFLTQLEKNKLSTQQIAYILEKAGCSIYQALEINDAEITSLMLDRRTSITKNESSNLLDRAINSGYIENVKVLLKHGPELYERLGIYFKKVMADKSESSMKFHLEQLIDWEVITEDFIRKVASVFKTGNMDEIQLYLNLGIDEYTRQKFNWELFVGLLGNENINCLEIMKNRKFNVNGLDMNGSSILHKAVSEGNKEVISYLLDNGADINITDVKGRTPLFRLFDDDDELAEFLIEAGADLQIIDKDGKSIVNWDPCDFIIANICILWIKKLIKKSVITAIIKYSRVNSDKTYASHLLDLIWMENQNVSKPVSLLSVLIDKVEKTAGYVKNNGDIKNIIALYCEKELQDTYETMLRKNLERAVKINELRPKAAEFFSVVMGICQPCHLVIEKIVGYLSYRDLLLFEGKDLELEFM